MNFNEMPWLVTADAAGDVMNFGPFKSPEAAVEYRDGLRVDGRQAEAWAAQVPDPRRLTTP